MKRLLIIAYHFPPLAGSSGIQRTLRFVQYLPRFGWEALVLTCHPRAYEETDENLLADVPAGTLVKRAFALDTARHLSIRGWYPEILARPDRWASWWLGAVIAGREIIRSHRPHAILSTYPIATAHQIACTLASGSGLPWVADFRDPMVWDEWPPDRRTWKSYKKIEERALARAAACTFTTGGAMRHYRASFPGTTSRLAVIENGYDESAFADAARDGAEFEPLNAGILTLLHSGIVYPEERDPTQLFAALAILKAQGIGAGRLRIRFRAAVHDGLLRDLAGRHDVEDMIEIMPSLTYRSALTEMLRADGLLILQAAICNTQVPAKLYEYIRARRPILALTDVAGDTADALRGCGVTAVASIEQATEIAALLGDFVLEKRQGMCATEEAIVNASREQRTRQLADLLDGIAQ